MSLHKLTAGDGYTYLTRQVAAGDVTHRGTDALSDYYAQQGESPGRWISTGAPGLPGFPETATVTEDQMVALFGEGRHPDALRIEKQMAAAGHDVPAILAATRLGSPYKVHSGATAFRVLLAIRYEAVNAKAGLPRDWPIPENERAQIRTLLTRELFTNQYGRAPLDARELSGFMAKACAQPTTAVAGYDLTFTPVKSVSTLWAVAPTEVAAAIEACHDQVVAETMQWLEDTAAYTRRGRNGVRQVNVHGLIAAAFTHRDSRAGDPNLHTHVAVSNKVCALDGSWLALDGRPIHKLAVAASERYNTRLEALLVDRLGVAFTERPGTDPAKRPVREIVGIDAALSASWSARRASIDVRRAELSAQFQATHGRPPGPVEALKLAQRATLETRQGKHAPRSLAEQRASWRADALRVLGSSERLMAMLDAVRRPAVPPRAPAVIDADWVADTAETVLTTVASGRATWQEAHVRAEAERQVRAADVRLEQVPAAVERIVAAALSPAWSLPLGVAEPVSEPAVLRRKDGTSMYSTAGMQLYTSPAVVAAERSLIAAARQVGGRTADPAAVEAALLASAARGVTLNPGQAALVRELATSGARLQLALAPAGTGKTTAMAVLAKTWIDDGGTVVGLAPSAAAAAVFGAELGAPTDTLAKLIWSLDSQEGQGSGNAGGAAIPAGQARASVPDWVRQIGPDTLVVLDEAGMAGTPELARAVEFVLQRGGSVRLIGDDQQLAAIGAGGVLRDLAETAGALTLSQVVRFHDPAEGAASLALRAGDRSAIGFYIDRGRVHVGDAGTVVDAAYEAWAADRAAGRDSLMLAPTREVAVALNARARADRLAAHGDAHDGAVGVAGREARLADGSAASAGDTVITRRNNRRLAISASDWVKNGDRWSVQQVLQDGSLQVQHLASGRRIVLPADYARAHVALGYASTVHAAQGSTAELCHTVATGAESRQLLYVAMTRGRAGNHLYLQSASDGDEHDVIRPNTLRPPTAVELLSRIVCRDGSQTSATTSQRALTTPALRLAEAADRYHDSLSIAAEALLGPDRLADLDDAAERSLPGLTAACGYPTLRAHLTLLAVDGRDAEAALLAAIAQADLSDARDPAAVLDWRLDPTGRHNTDNSADTGENAAGMSGPLAWLPAVPAALAADPDWGRYLQTRAAHTADLAERIRADARSWTPTSAPAWARALLGADRELVTALAVWRAAQHVDDEDLRPAGAPRLSAADVRAQRSLQQASRAALGGTPATADLWVRLADTLEPRLLQDPFWPLLADRLAAADRAGIDITALASRAAADGPLPDEMPAAALWWRLSRHLAPAALVASNSTTAGTASTLRPAWTSSLITLVGEVPAQHVVADPAWPALVAAVTEATAGGWRPEQVLQTAYELVGALTDGRHHDTDPTNPAGLRADELTTALVWRVAMLNEVDALTGPDDLDSLPPDPADWDLLPPEDLHELEPTADLSDLATTDGSNLDQAYNCEIDAWFARLEPPPEAESDEQPHRPAGPADDVDAAGQPALTVAVASRERLLQLNEQALAFFIDKYAGSWAAIHLLERLGDDLTADARFHPGHAPASWTALTDHLRGLGAEDHELLAAGLASTARNGRLIDRFRDRLMLPIHSPRGEVIGFIGRRNPDTPDAGPKYLNTGETALFSKGAQLYGIHENADALTAGARPALVEGPVDAIAITLAGDGQVVGVATLGTAFTDRQADQLRPYIRDGRPEIIVATDNDQAGRKAATRAYWQLTARGANPSHLVLPDGQDPAQLLQDSGPAALRQALTSPPTLARALVGDAVRQYADRLQHVEGQVLASRAAADVIGALPPAHWLEHITLLNTLVDLSPGATHMAVLDAGQAWTQNPEGFTRRRLGEQPCRSSTLAPAAARTPAAEAPASPTEPDRAGASEITEQWAGDVWLEVGRAVDPRLVQGRDWKPLAAALDRASRAGYDVQQHLPRLAAQGPLPEQQPARALHYRLVQECDAALTPRPHPAELAEQTAAAQARITEQTEQQDNQEALGRANGTPPASGPEAPKMPTAAQLAPPDASLRRSGPRR